MSQNIPNVTVVKKPDAAHHYEIVTKEQDEASENKLQTEALEKSDENTYQDANFDDMSLEEVTETASRLEQELLCLKSEIEDLQTAIKTNEEIRQTYESQLEQVKQEIEKLGKELQKAETPQKKVSIRKRLTSLRGNVSSLQALINKATGTIQIDNQMKSNAMSEYTSANSNYRKASLVQSKKEAEVNRQMQAAQYDASRTSIDVAPAGNTGNASVGATGASNVAAAVSSAGNSSSAYSAVPKGASTGKASDNLINFLKQKESCRLQAYQDSGGVWTIGYGHTGGVQEGQTITQAQAEQFLRQDLASFENDVASLAQSTGVQLTQGQFDALVSFTYNCGGGNLRKSGIMQMLKTGNISGAQNKMKEYVRDKKHNVLQGLVTRRAEEASWLAV